MSSLPSCGLNPCSSVRVSCGRVSASAQFVSVNHTAVSTLAGDLVANFDEYARDFEWNLEWHFHRDSDPTLTTQYLFVLDSLNFCFWPSPGFEYEQLASGLKGALEADPSVFEADRLVSLDVASFSSWFYPWEVPNAEERVERLKELGSALAEGYEGQAYKLVESCDRSAVKLVRKIIELLPGFRDTSVLDARLVHFYKRAQILCGDLWAAFGMAREGSSPFAFRDLEQLTMFADYRVPQLLHHLKVLVYADELLAKVTAGAEIEFGSRMETEIRACTVVAVETLRAEMELLGKHPLSIELDWVLWNMGTRGLATMSLHHRTHTIYY